MRGFMYTAVATAMRAVDSSGRGLALGVVSDGRLVYSEEARESPPRHLMENHAGFVPVAVGTLTDKLLGSSHQGFFNMHPA